MSNYQLPKYFEIEDELFEIRNNGDYRIVLSCFNIISNISLSEYERIIACIQVFYTNFETVEDVLACEHLQELIDKMYWFFDCGSDYKKTARSYKLVDWNTDSLLICSAINKVAGRDVRDAEYIHWWTFVGYYMEIGECSLSQVLSIRYKMAKGQKLEKYEQQFKTENPQYFEIDFRTQEDMQLDDLIRNMWEGGQLANG